MTLSELIERVEGLDGPSREVDCEIAVAVDGFVAKRCEWKDDPDYIDMREGAAIYPGHGGGQLVPAYTDSLDAAIALTERGLPGWGLSIERHPVYGDWWDAAIFDQMPKTVSNARKQTSALALCLSVLRALSAQERNDG